MAELKVSPTGGGHFRVEVIEGSTSTTHDVAVSAATIERLEWKGTPEELIRRSFDFLLEREPKESILREFEISAIGRYFPEYEEIAQKGFE